MCFQHSQGKQKSAHSSVLKFQCTPEHLLRQGSIQRSLFSPILFLSLTSKSYSVHLSGCWQGIEDIQNADLPELCSWQSWKIIPTVFNSMPYLNRVHLSPSQIDHLADSTTGSLITLDSIAPLKKMIKEISSIVQPPNVQTEEKTRKEMMLHQTGRLSFCLAG